MRSIKDRAADRWWDTWVTRWLTKSEAKRLAETFLASLDLLEDYAVVHQVTRDEDIVLSDPDSGVTAHWVARGGNIETSMPRENIFKLPRDMVGFHISEYEDKVRKHFTGNLRRLNGFALGRLVQEIDLRVWKILQSAGWDVRLGVTTEALTAAVEALEDPVVVGPTTDIMRFSATSGLVDRGAAIWPLPSSDRLDREIIVYPRSALHVGAFGGLLYKTWTEDDNWYWHYMGRADLGMVMTDGNKITRFVIETTEPEMA